MIRKLQKKFISITAAALFLMIFLVMAAINGIFIFQTNRMIDSRLDFIMREPGSPQNNNNLRRDRENQQPDLFPHFGDKLRIQSDGCLIFLAQDGSVAEIKQDADKYSEEELTDIALSLNTSRKMQGWHQYFKYRIEEHTAEDGSSMTVIGLVNASSDLYSMITMLLITTATGFFSFLLVLLIIVFVSGKAVKPIAESYTKQKQFVTDAGHELKTPLTVISANNELSRMIYGDSEWFDSIDRQVAKMNGLVRSLITLAKMDEGQKPEFAPFNLSDAVYDTAKSFENLIHSTDRLLTLDIADNINYTGDESKLRQVVSILMDNAAKYCDEKGKIAVKLSRDRQIRLQVINDFAKAEECDFSRVFERFYRADKARSSDGSYGLGLSIAKSIAELHKGEIKAVALAHDRIMFEVVL